MKLANAGFFMPGV